jgi:RNA polymerase sigma-70 factor (ECF subfamily)
VRDRSRDETRFVELATEVGPELLNYFERRVRGEAADLLAELMTTAWRRIADLPADHEASRMWLFGIARNVLRNSARTSIRRERLADALRDSIAIDEGLDTAEQIAVRDAVQRLAPDLAEIVMLVHWEGLTIAEAGQLQDVTASTARGRYQRAKASLRDALIETKTSRVNAF